MIDGIKLAVGGFMWFFQWFGATLWMLVYAIGSLLLMFLDFVQDCFKKLAGLDTYYYEGTTSAFEKEDILQRLLTTPEILKAFGSLVVVGIILLFIFTIVQFIRIEYTTEGAKNSKGNIIQQSLKSLAMFVIVPIATLIGIFLSNKILQILDNATDPSPGSTIAGNIFKISVYDANPVRAGESKISGFGKMQQEAIFLSDYDAYDGPVFKGTYWGKNFWGETVIKTAKLKIEGYENDNMDAIKGFANVAKMQVEDTGKTEISPTGIVTSVYKIFAGSDDVVFKNGWIGKSVTIKKIDPAQLAPSVLSGKEGEELAEAIDDMMAHRNREDAQITTNAYTGDWKGNFTGVGLKKGDGLDYTNTFAVVYFYNMQDISYFTLFVCSGFALVCLYKAAFGMVMRLYMCAILFVISPPIIAMAPMDNGKALSSWKSKFIGQVLAGYGTVVALNLFFTVLPIIEKIELFSDTHTNELTGKADVPWRILPASFFNGLVQMVFVLVGCFMLKDISKTISGLIGAEDAMASGDGMSKQVGSAVAKTAAVGMGLAVAGGGALLSAGSGIAAKMSANKGTTQGYRDASKNLNKANKDLEKAQKSGDKKAIKEAEKEVEKQKKAVQKEASRPEMNTQKAQKARAKAAQLQLASQRFSAGTKGNIKKMVSGSKAGKFVSGALGDFTPEFLGGKGIHGHDAEISGANSYYEGLIKQEGKDMSRKAEAKSIAGMGVVATAMQHTADRATMESAASNLNKTLEQGAKQATAEMTDMKNQMVNIMKDIQAGLMDKDKGADQMTALYQQARSTGLLTQNSEKTIGQSIADFRSGAISAMDVEATLNTNGTFETKFEAAMNDPAIEAKLKNLEANIKSGNQKAVDLNTRQLQTMFDKYNIKTENLSQLMNKIASEASRSKAEEKDLKKLLAQLGKLSK